MIRTNPETNQTANIECRLYQYHVTLSDSDMENATAWFFDETKAIEYAENVLNHAPCAIGVIQFISRFRSESSYCVDGHRVTVHDDGAVHASSLDVTDELLQRLMIHFLQAYASYCFWHVEFTAKHSNANYRPELLPFDFPNGLYRRER